jgi:hypothetical protein
MVPSAVSVVTRWFYDTEVKNYKGGEWEIKQLQTSATSILITDYPRSIHVDFHGYPSKIRPRGIWELQTRSMDREESKLAGPLK